MCDPGSPGAPEAHHVAPASYPMADGAELPALTCTPDHAVATVVVAPDLFGLSAGTRLVMQRLAHAGLASVALGYHQRVGPDTPEDEESARARRRAMDETLALADLSSTVDAVRRRTRVPAGSRVAVLGLCMGGTMALALAAERADLAVVSCYGFPRSSQMPAVACPRPLDLVGSMSGPILGVWGDEDRSVPMADVDALAASLRQHQVEAEVTVWPGVGHGFLTGRDPSSRKVAHEAWPRITSFVRSRI